jgi:hypothetical protein
MIISDALVSDVGGCPVSTSSLTSTLISKISPVSTPKEGGENASSGRERIGTTTAETGKLGWCGTSTGTPTVATGASTRSSYGWSSPKDVTSSS